MKIFSMWCSAIFTAILLTGMSAAASEQQAAVPSGHLAGFVGKTCSGEFVVTGKRHTGLEGTIEVEIASIEGSQISGEVLKAKPSKLHYPHDFSGTINGGTADTTTDYGAMHFVFNNDGTLSGDAIVDENKAATKKLGHGRVELALRSLSCS
jgi:hypothetical protein